MAYKNVVGARRASWRVLSSIEAKEKEKGEESKVAAISGYRQKVERELEKICQELLEVLEKHLLPQDKTPEGQVFYWKMAGDYWRYLAEFAEAEDRAAKAGEVRRFSLIVLFCAFGGWFFVVFVCGNGDACGSCATFYPSTPLPAPQAKKKYEQATKVASEQQLPPTNPIRLGLALNYSVFYYEILNEPQQACGLAKTAFDDAISELDSLQEEQYKDATLIMQLIRDNLTLWTSDNGEDEQKVDGEEEQ